VKTYTAADMDQLVAAAKKEGTLNLYTASVYADFLSKPFEAMYPWAKVNVTQLMPGDAAAKLLAEVNAGVVRGDVVDFKEGSLAPFIKAHALARISVPNDSLMQPSLKDPGGYSHPMLQTLNVLIYNTKLISSGPAKIADLTDPKWKGKLAIDSPLSAMAAGPILASERKPMGDAAWDQWLTALKNNDPSVLPSTSDTFDAVVRGDRAICFCSYQDILNTPNAPLAVDWTDQDGAGIVSTPGIAVVPVGAQHPAMAALWLNWMESPTGGQVGFAHSNRFPAAIKGVPGADKVTLPPGIKVAPVANLTDYYADPTTYNDAFKKYFLGQS
jgi:ABC-type Fe3+ transport system substrate-binding protein